VDCTVYCKKKKKRVVEALGRPAVHSIIVGSYDGSFLVESFCYFFC
jgi:hypothetical protein